MAHADDPQRRRVRIRMAVLIGCVVLSLPALFFSTLALMVALSVALSEPLVDASARKIVWGGIAVLLSWCALAALATAWAQVRSGHRGWAVAGLLSGITCTVLYIPFSVTALPALSLGLYLAVGALRRPSRARVAQR